MARKSKKKSRKLKQSFRSRKIPIDVYVLIIWLIVVFVLVIYNSLISEFSVVPQQEPFRGDIRPSSPPDGEKCSDVEFIPKEAEGKFRFAVYPHTNKEWKKKGDSFDSFQDFYNAISLYDHRRSTWFQVADDVALCLQNKKNGGVDWGVLPGYALQSIRFSDVLGVTRTEKGRVCGFITIAVRSYADKKEKRLAVADLHVICATYKQGSNLIKKSLQYLKDQNFDIVTLEATNENLVEFYKKFGFLVGWGGKESKDPKREIQERTKPYSIELWEVKDENTKLYATEDKESFRNVLNNIPMSLSLKKNDEMMKKFENNRSA